MDNLMDNPTDNRTDFLDEKEKRVHDGFFSLK